MDKYEPSNAVKTVANLRTPNKGKHKEDEVYETHGRKILNDFVIKTNRILENIKFNVR